jgi:hypothetical protein
MTGVKTNSNGILDYVPENLKILLRFQQKKKPIIFISHMDIQIKLLG